VHCSICVCSYRLAPNVTFPTPFEDCLKATRYFFSHAHEFGVDTRRLAVAGVYEYLALVIIIHSMLYSHLNISVCLCIIALLRHEIRFLLSEIKFFLHIQ